MSGKTVSAEEAQAQLKDLLDLVRGGDEVLISEDEKVFARLAPVKEEVTEEKKQRTPGLLRGVVKHISPDFDDPVDESFLLGEDK
jgi:antitoxin (DNA-binding transcriptional repressor) of toxin-antitoxin stability system